MQMYKVFIKEQQILFSKKIEKNLPNWEVKSIVNPKKGQYKEIIEILWKNEGLQLFHIQTENIEEAFQLFCDNFKIIYAAGGLVKNNLDELLFIYRLNKWDLPKGKVEEGETISEAAMREVEEECGIKDLDLLDKAKNTYHVYKINGEFILKETHWFHMRTNYKGPLIPQEEEDISQASWVKTTQMQKQLENTYASIRDLLSSVDKTYRVN